MQRGVVGMGWQGREFVLASFHPHYPPVLEAFTPLPPCVLAYLKPLPLVICSALRVFPARGWGV